MENILQNLRKESMGNLFSFNFRVRGQLFAINFLVSGFIILFLTNCSTVVSQMEKESENLDLSLSFATKMYKKKRQKSQTSEGKDPRAYFHYLMSLEAEKKFRFEKAASHYKEIVKYDPETENFFEKHVRLLLRIGDFDEAIAAGQEALKQFPKNKAIHMDMGDILSSQGKADSAIYHYEKVIQINPQSARATLLKGAILENQGKWDQAKDLYQQAAKLEHNNPLGQFYLGRALLQGNDLENAEKSFQMAVVLKPNLLQARKYLAWVYERLGKPKEALKEYNLLVKLKQDNAFIKERIEKLQYFSDPAYKNEIFNHKGIPDELSNQLNVHMRIAAIYFEEALYLKALDELQLVAVADDNKDPHVLMARIYENHGRLDKAIKEFEILRKLEPGSMDILRYSARLYHLAEQPDSAIRLLSTAVKKEPENDQIYHSLALAYVSKKENEKAVEILKKALALNPKKDAYYFEVGALMEKIGDFKGAIENMRQAIEINPLHSNAHNFLGYIYALEGRDLDLALEHLTKALTIQPRNGYFLDSLGWIYFKKGELEKALVQIQKALIYTDPDPVLYDHLGDILFSLKNYDEAKGAWKNSRSLTLNQKGDLGGEMPNPQTLQEKIEKAKKLIQKSY